MKLTRIDWLPLLHTVQFRRKSANWVLTGIVSYKSRMAWKSSCVIHSNSYEYPQHIPSGKVLKSADNITKPLLFSNWWRLLFEWIRTWTTVRTTRDTTEWGTVWDKANSWGRMFWIVDTTRIYRRDNQREKDRNATQGQNGIVHIVRMNRECVSQCGIQIILWIIIQHSLVIMTWWITRIW